MADSSLDDARRELNRAQDALHDAQVLFDGDGTDAGVLNRLYYRQQADYGGDVSDVGIDDLVGEVGEFVSHMAAFVETEKSG